MKKKQETKSKKRLILKAPKGSVVVAGLQNGGGPTDFVQSFKESGGK